MITDAGDVPAANGSRIAAGRIYRLSSGLARADELGALEAIGLRRIVDLRGTDEDRSVIRDWTSANGVDYVSQPIPAAGKVDWVELAAQTPSEAEAIEYLTSVYREIVSDHGEQIAATIGAMAEELPAGYGCAAGKDRTGIVTAFLQVLLGVPEEQAVIGYVNGAPSVEDLGPLARDYLDLPESEPIPAGIAAFLRPVPEAMLATLDYVKTNDGSVAAYLQRNGLAPETAEELRGHLLLETSPSS